MTTVARESVDEFDPKATSRRVDHAQRAVKRTLAIAVVVCGAIFIVVGLLPGVFYHVFAAPVYLPLHALAELASIFVSAAIFLVNWHAFQQRRNQRNLFIGVAFLGVAALDTLHTLSFPGMPEFVTASSTNKGILYWLAARLVAAFALLCAAFIDRDTSRLNLNPRALLAGMLAIVAAVFVAMSYYEQALPPMFVAGVGLTPLKVGLEYGVIALSIAAVVAYWRQREEGGKPDASREKLIAALVVIVFAEVAFTLYRSAYDSYNLLGHLYKIVAYYFIFRALFVSSIVEPYRALARSEAEQGRLFRSERRQARELLALGRLLHAPLQLEERLNTVVRSMRGLLEAEGAAILVLDGSGQSFVVAAGDGLMLGDKRLPASGTVALKVLEGKVARWIDDLSDAPDVSSPVAASGLFRSLLAVPLEIDGEVVGVLEAYTKRPSAFGSRQAALLGGYADAAGVAIGNARAHDQIQRLLGQVREHEQVLADQNDELRAQAGQIQAQNEEIQTQSEELRAQNEELESRQQDLERANRGLSELSEASQRQAAELQAVIDATADGILVVDAEQRVVAVNPALEAMTGTPASNLVGRSCKYLLHACQGDGEFVCDSACPFLHAPGEAPRNVDALVPGPVGKDVWVNIVYGPLYDETGKLTGVVHAIRDISARKELEAQKDEFLSIAAHDLKSPLTAIRGYAQLIKRRALREQRSEDDVRGLDVIESQVERMLEIINRLLDLARIQMGRYELQPEPVDLRALAQRVVSQQRVTAERHELRLELGEGELAGLWDRSAVERVLANLVENAIKYSPKGGVVTVSVARRSDHVVVTISDQGIGIPEADLPHIFERYYRSSKASEASRGLGLGLYIARGIIESHGGRIRAESVPDQGTTVSFTLPVRPT